MAFICYDFQNCDEVSFYMRKDFRDELNVPRRQEHHMIERGDTNALLFYINKYMNTNVFNKRPDTPAYLIMPKIPSSYTPLF